VSPAKRWIGATTT